MSRQEGDPRTRSLLPVVAAAILAAILYINALPGPFVYDDTSEIRDNPDLRDLSFVFEAFSGEPWKAERGYGFTYRPLSWSAATILYAIGGGSPLPFHLANIILHAGCVLLVGLLVHRFAPGNPATDSGFLAAGASSAFLFAAHPVHAEAVAWVSGRSELLSATFLLGAWLVFESRGAWVRRGLLSALLLLAALFCKETAAIGIVIFPVAAFITRYARGEDASPSIRPDALRPLLFHAAAFAIYLVARMAALGQIGRGAVRGSALLNPLEGVGLFDRALSAIAVIPQHLRLLLWPADLSIDYGFDQISVATSPLDPRVIASVILISAAIGGLWFVRGSWGRIAFALCLLYSIAALPTSNLLVLPASIFAERYLYLPSAIACAGAGIILARLAGTRKGAAAIGLIAILAGCAARTIDRNRDWLDAESLYRSSIEATPRAARLHYNLGVVLRDRGRGQEAEASFRRATGIAPAYADARAELGLALIAGGRIEEALPELRRAAGDAPADPVILNNLGGAYLTIGRAEEAVPLLRRALELDPRSTDALGNLGKAALDRGDLAEAGRSFLAILALDPNAVSAYVGLGAVAAASGDIAGAVSRFRQAVQIDPADGDAAYNLARALMAAGDAAGALPVLQDLAARYPEDAEVRALLEQARSASGKR